MPTDEGYEVHAGVAEGASRWRIKGVPHGRYFLDAIAQPSESLPGEAPFRVLTEQELDSDGQTIWYGDRYYAREAAKAAEGSWVRIDATNVSPWQESDSIEIMSRQAEVWRTATVDFDPESEVQRSPPPTDATSLDGWELDLHRMTDSYGYDLHLLTPSDDLVVVQTRISSTPTM